MPWQTSLATFGHAKKTPEVVREGIARSGATQADARVRMGEHVISRDDETLRAIGEANVTGGVSGCPYDFDDPSRYRQAVAVAHNLVWYERFGARSTSENAENMVGVARRHFPRAHPLAQQVDIPPTTRSTVESCSFVPMHDHVGAGLLPYRVGQSEMIRVLVRDRYAADLLQGPPGPGELSCEMAEIVVGSPARIHEMYPAIAVVDRVAPGEVDSLGLRDGHRNRADTMLWLNRCWQFVGSDPKTLTSNTLMRLL
nr:hypothetical protein [Microbacterium sp.]